MSDGDAMTKMTKMTMMSFPDVPYPSLRESRFRSAGSWIFGKRIDDGAEGLWRVHDDLYDLTDFVAIHPGGETWLSYTKGTDITEAFESHHIGNAAASLLQRYRVRAAATKRSSPFTFKEHGFYSTLKRRVAKELPKIPAAVNDKSKRLMDALALGMFALAIVANRHETWCWSKWGACLLAAVFMTWTTVCSHNFVHKRDNWRMYFHNFSYTTYREFRIIHVLSHHLYPNTLRDAEMVIFEPFFQWLPKKSKSALVRYGAAVYGLLFLAVFFDAAIIMRVVSHFKFDGYPGFCRSDLVMFTLPLSMWLNGGNCGLGDALVTWLVILHLATFITMCISLHAAHHHPDVFHDGDVPLEDRDWGLHQLNAVMDRGDVDSSFFAVMTNYGDHVLHHLFPTLDHAVLHELRDVFADTCRQFGVAPRTSNVLGMLVGSFEQIARTEARKTRIAVA